MTSPVYLACSSRERVQEEQLDSLGRLACQAAASFWSATERNWNCLYHVDINTCMHVILKLEFKIEAILMVKLRHATWLVCIMYACMYVCDVFVCECVCVSVCVCVCVCVCA